MRLAIPDLISNSYFPALAATVAVPLIGFGSFQPFQWLVVDADSVPLIRGLRPVSARSFEAGWPVN